MPSKAEQSANTKAALTEAAIALFGEKGYRATSLKAIGERAGISHGSIPFHFGSKEGLLLAVVEVGFRRFSDAVIQPLRGHQRDFGMRDLEALLDAQIRFSEEQPEIGRVFQVLMAEAIGPSPELRPHYRAFHTRIHQLGCDWVREGVARGAFRDDLDVEATVDAVLGYLTGVRLHDLLAGVDRARIHRQMLSILKGGVLAADGGSE